MYLDVAGASVVNSTYQGMVEIKSRQLSLQGKGLKHLKGIKGEGSLWPLYGGWKPGKPEKLNGMLRYTLHVTMAELDVNALYSMDVNYHKV